MATTRKQERDAGSGQWVKKGTAKASPKTTVTETVKYPKRKGK